MKFSYHHMSYMILLGGMFGMLTKCMYSFTLLIYLELLMLGLLLNLSSMMSLGVIPSFTLIIFMVLNVCEASMGLGLLISVTRSNLTSLLVTYSLSSW